MPIKPRGPDSPSHPKVARLILVGLAALATLLPVAGCGAGSEAAAVERVDSAGVVLVTGPGEDRPLGWRFEPELTLGGEEFFEVSRWNVDTDARGVIHVLDRTGKRVLRYAPDGSPLGEIGGPGSGPGELEWPSTLEVTPDGRIHVADFGRGRVITWGPDGSLLGEDPGADPGATFRVLADAEVRELDTFSRDSLGSRLVRIAAGDTTELARVAAPSRPIHLESCGMRFSGMPPVLSHRLIWDAAGDRIAVVAGPAYDIRVADADGRPLRVRRRMEPAEATEATALAELGEGMPVGTSSGMRICEPEEVVEQRGIAERVPLIERIAVDPDGRLWVQRFVPGDDPGAIDLFAADGTYLGSLPAGTPLPVGFLPDGRALVADTDAMDVQRLLIGRFEPEAG